MMLVGVPVGLSEIIVGSIKAITGRKNNEIVIGIKTLVVVVGTIIIAVLVNGLKVRTQMLGRGPLVRTHFERADQEILLV
ncbi:hypothetical protein ccbrp13_37350 [Ktedonobacteria bacterium brp13]|nr:hypothetical protein ccbrp13_37350 [Ktedonobacteria bacterium brp13]